jgi:hypothetical protein
MLHEASTFLVATHDTLAGSRPPRGSSERWACHPRPTRHRLSAQLKGSGVGCFQVPAHRVEPSTCPLRTWTRPRRLDRADRPGSPVPRPDGRALLEAARMTAC